MHRPYKLSGALGSAPWMAPPVALAGTLACAWAYAYLSVYSPIAGWVTLLFLVGFCLGEVFSLSLGAKWSKCRSQGFMTALGAVTGLITVYLSWVCFVAVYLGRYMESDPPGALELLRSPAALWEVILALNESGWFEIKEVTPSGLGLWVLWGTEAAALVLAGAVGGWVALRDEVFCEGCQRWLQDKEFEVCLAVPSDPKLLERVAAGELSALRGVERVPAGHMPHVTVNLQLCPECQETWAFDVDVVSATVDEKGQEKLSSEDLSPIFLLSAEELPLLRALMNKSLEAPASGVEEAQEPGEGGQAEV